MYPSKCTSLKTYLVVMSWFAHSLNPVYTRLLVGSMVGLLVVMMGAKVGTGVGTLVGFSVVGSPNEGVIDGEEDGAMGYCKRI